VATLANGRVLYLRRTPHDQGRKLGKGAADLIGESVARGNAQVERAATGVDLSPYTARTRRSERRVSRVYPELLEVLQATSQTAGRMTLAVGVNSYGVAVGTSGQWSKRVIVDLARGDAAWHIPNLQLVLRHARSADEALDMVRDQPRVAGMNMTVADDRRAYA